MTKIDLKKILMNDMVLTFYFIEIFLKTTCYRHSVSS